MLIFLRHRSDLVLDRPPFVEGEGRLQLIQQEDLFPRFLHSMADQAVDEEYPLLGVGPDVLFELASLSVEFLLGCAILQMN